MRELFGAIGLMYLLIITGFATIIVTMIMITINTFKIRHRLENIETLLYKERPYEQDQEQNIYETSSTAYTSLFGSKRE